MKRMLIYSALSLLLVFLTLYYQRATGPTYEKEISFELQGQSFEVELPRSHEINTPCLVKTGITDTTISGRIYYKRYPTRDNYKAKEFFRNDGELVAKLPNQLPAGKLKYYMEFSSDGKTRTLLKDNPVIIRFKGPVPSNVLITHIFFMFASMFLSNLAGILAFRRDDRYILFSRLTLLFLFIGGLILGPMVQKYAFGLWWSGVPFGWDLTDNKLLLSFLVWLTAVVGNIRKRRPYLAVAATLILIVMYAIPHSTMGSELDYESGKVVTGD